MAEEINYRYRISVSLSGISEAASGLDALKKACAGKFGISKTARDSLRELGESISGLDSGKLTEVAGAMKTLSQLDTLRGIPKGFRAGLRELMEIANGFTDEDVARLKAIADAIAPLNGFSAKLSGIGSAAAKIKKAGAGEATDYGTSDVDGPGGSAASNAEDVAGATGKAAKKAKSFREQFQEALLKAENLKKILSSTLAPLKTLGRLLLAPLKAAASYVKTVFRMIRTRVIRTAITSVTNSFSEGIEKLYRWGEAYDSEFAGKLDSFKTDLEWIRQSFATMFKPLISALTPVFGKVAEWVVGIFNKVQQFLAELTGQDTWTRVIRNEVKFAEAAEDAEEALEGQLMAFDELNVITTDSNGDTTSATETDYGSMFSTESVKTSADSFASKLKKAFEDEGFEGVGELIGQKIADSFGPVDWEELGANAADLVNGIYEMIDGALGGVTISDIFTLIQSFLDNLSDELKDKLVLALTVGMLFKWVTSVTSALVKAAIETALKTGISNALGIAGTGTAAAATAGGATLAGTLTSGLMLSIPIAIALIGTIVAAYVANRKTDSLLDAFDEKVKMSTPTEVEIPDVEFTDPLTGETLTLNPGELEAEILAKATASNEAKLHGAQEAVDITDDITRSAMTAVMNKYGMAFVESNYDELEEGVKDAIEEAITDASAGGTTATTAVHGTKRVLVAYASGGFPEDGLFLANHSELVGQFSNGRTAVANNAQIVEGIADGVRSANSEQNDLLREQNQLLYRLVAKSGSATASSRLGQLMAQSQRMYRTVTG